MSEILDQHGRAARQHQKPNPIHKLIYFLGLRQSNPENPRSRHGEHKSVEQRRFEMETAVYRLARTGAVIAVFAAMIYYRQMRVAERQLAEMQTQRMLDERAWVFVKRIETNTKGKGTYWITFANTGRTPAIKIRNYVNQAVDPKMIPAFDKETGPFQVMLAPNSEGFTETPERTNEGLIYFYGTVWYDDIFTNHHWSQFCFQLPTPTGPVVAPGIHFSTDDDKQPDAPK